MTKPPIDKSVEKENLNMNESSDWDKIRQGWVREQSDRVQAYADRYFMTDDELPLHRHFILVSLFLFFLVFVVWASFATLDETARGEGGEGRYALLRG